MIRFKTVDRVYDGELLQSCEFCFADVNWNEHDEHCERMQIGYAKHFGTDDFARIAVSAESLS